MARGVLATEVVDEGVKLKSRVRFMGKVEQVIVDGRPRRQQVAEI